jgi:integrase
MTERNTVSENTELEINKKPARKEKKERGLKKLEDGRWRVSWMFEGKYHRIKVRNRSEAKAYLEKIHTDIREDRYLDVKQKPVKTTFEDSANRFLLWSKSSNARSTQELDKLCVRTWLAFPAFKGKTLDKITVSDVQRYKESLFHEKIKNSTCRAGKPLSPRTIDIRISRLKRLFSLCVIWELCEHNPVLKVKLLKKDNKITRFLSEEEETRLMEHASPALRQVIQFALHTGMRRGEILGLKWSDINFQTHVAVIPATRAKGKRERVIPLNAVAFKIIQDIPHPINREALVFSNQNGKIWDRLRKQWEHARTLAGLKDFRFHDLRHTFASKLAMSGISLTVIKELLGHTDYETTLRYAHLAQGFTNDAVTVLEPQNRKLHFCCTQGNASGEVKKVVDASD